MTYTEEKRPILHGGIGNKKKVLFDEHNINGDSVPHETGPNCFPEQDDFSWLIIGLMGGIMFFSMITMIGWPSWLAALATHQSDVFAPVVANPMFAALACLAVAIITRKAKIKGCEGISLYPFHLKTASIYGALASLASILHAFCGLPSRTPAFVQAFSFVLMLPSVAMTRYIIRCKGFSWRQGACLLAVLVAIGLTGVSISAHTGRVPGTLLILRPQSVNATNPTNASIANTVPPLVQTWPDYAAALWSLGFAFGYVLLGVSLALVEEPLKFEGAHPIVLCMYTQLLTFCIVAFLFWFDLIPTFGMVSTLREFRHNVHRGFKCLLGIGGGCGPLPWRGWIYIVSTITLPILQFLLVVEGDGTVFPVILSAVAVPVSCLYWTLISDTGSAFVWNPVYLGWQTTFVIVALIVIAPASVLYRYYGLRSEREKFEQL